jgi:RNAse (barnase) inhibitor barstar
VAYVRVVFLDGSRIETKLEFLDAVAAALSFPDYFGRNWDALDECLRDMTEPTILEWADAERFAVADPEGFQGALSCFADTTGSVTLRLT